MNADRFLELYEQISEAPDAITRMRRIVLDLAVRGKLTAPDFHGHTARSLVDALQTAKVRAGNKAVFSVVKPAEIPFELPEHWAWSRVGEICHQTGSGSTPRGGKSAYVDEGILFLRSQNVYDVGLRLSDVAFIPIETHQKMARTAVRANDILLNITGGSIGRCALVPSDFDTANVSQHVSIVRCGLAGFQSYLHLAIRSPYFQKFIFDEQNGAGREGLPKKKMDLIPIPLPPDQTQYDIVAKVDELMALCDRLEKARKTREDTRDKLTAATIARLTALEATAASETDGTNTPAGVAPNQAEPENAETGPLSGTATAQPSDFPTHARFAIETLPALTSRPDQIKTLRQTILNLAVRGKLVEQDAADEPASELVQRARAAKDAIRKERRIGRIEDPEFSASRGESQSPIHWSWVHISEFALVLGGKRIPKGMSFSPQQTDNIYIRVTDMKDGTISSDQPKYISDEVQLHIAKYTITKNDIYITIAGTIGAVGTVPDAFDGHNLTENAARIVFREIDRHFLVLALNSEDVQSQFAEKTKQMAQPKLALKRILGARLPVPPLAEQHRIVATVDALMALCDRLEAALTTADTTRTRLLEALLHEALEPTSNIVVAAE